VQEEGRREHGNDKKERFEHSIGPGGIYDGVLLGGSWERGVENTDIDPAITGRILQGNGALFNAMPIG